MSKYKASKRIAVYAGSGNVYADLGYPDADEMLVKAQLVSKIAEIIRQRGLTAGSELGGLASRARAGGRILPRPFQ